MSQMDAVWARWLEAHKEPPTDESVQIDAISENRPDVLGTLYAAIKDRPLIRQVTGPGCEPD